MCGGQHHDSVFDGERVQVVQHDVVGFGEKRRLAGQRRVFIKNNLEQVGREDRRAVHLLPRLRQRDVLRVFFLLGVDGVFGIFGERLEHFEVAATDAHHVVLAAHVVLHVLQLRVVPPLAVDVELKLMLAFGKIDDGDEIAVRFNHRQTLPIAEGSTYVHLLAAAIPLEDCWKCRFLDVDLLCLRLAHRVRSLSGQLGQKFVLWWKRLGVDGIIVFDDESVSVGGALIEHERCAVCNRNRFINLW